MELVASLSEYVGQLYAGLPRYDERHAWKFCDALVAGSRKGFGTEPHHKALKVLKLMLPHVVQDSCPSSGGRGGALACLQRGGDVPLAEQLALRSAAERLCLWYRAHEVAQGSLLAGYFETAYTYFIDFYGEKDKKALRQEMQAAKFKPVALPAPKPKPAPKKGKTTTTTTSSNGSGNSHSNSSTAETTATTRTAPGTSAALATSLAGASSGGDARNDDGNSATVGDTLSTKTVPTTIKASTPSSTTQMATAKSRSESLSTAVSAPPSTAAATMNEPLRRVRPSPSAESQHTLEVELQPRISARRAPASQGANVDVPISNLAPVARPNDSSGGWIELARGPAYAEVEEWLRTGHTPASKLVSKNRRATAASQGAHGSTVPVVDMPGALAGRVAFDEWDVDAAPHMLEAYDNDALDGAWWRRKYRPEDEGESLSEGSDGEAPPDELLLDSRVIDRVREAAELGEEEEE